MYSQDDDREYGKGGVGLCSFIFNEKSWQRAGGCFFFLFLYRSVRCHPSFSENKYFIRLIVAFYAINVFKKLVASRA